MIGSKRIVYQRTNSGPTVLNPGNLSAADDLADTPDYFQPYIGSEDHPVRAGVGRISPDIGERNKKVLAANPGHAGTLVIGSVRGLDTKLESQPNTEPQLATPVTIDPLTGEIIGGSPGTKLIDTGLILGGMLHTLEAILTVQRAQIPQLPCQLEISGYKNALSNVYPTLIKFKLAQKTVPALKLFVQNNTTAVLYLDLIHDANPGGITVPIGGTFIASIVTDTISLLSAAVGPFTINGVVTGGVVVSAWSNMEWSRMWGEI
jgi:hypothetical protein